MSTITRIIQEDYDDVTDFEDGSWWPSIYLSMYPYDGSTGRKLGVRFRNISIYQGSKIISAKITFNSLNTRSSEINFRMYGENNSFPQIFSSKEDFNARSYTSEYVDWTNVPTWNQDSDYDYVGLETIVQSIVNRTDWSIGNDIAFFGIATSGAGGRNMKSFTDSASLCPRLTIEYDDPDGIATIHDYGLRISKDGYDVKTCADDECVLTSKLNSMKIPTALIGSTTLTCTKNYVSVTKTIAHNLGYIPAYEAWYKDENNVWRTAVSSPGIDLTSHEIHVQSPSSSIDSTNLYINMINRNVTTDRTATIYYIIYLDQME